MGIEIERLEPNGANGATVTATQRLWVSRDGESLVPDGDPNAASLFCVPGKRIAKAEAERFGLVKGVVQAPETKQVEPSENKAKPAKTRKTAKE